MKSSKLLLGILLASPLLVIAQVDHVKLISPFDKGNWTFPLQRDLNFYHRDDYADDGDKIGKKTDFNLNLDKTYFFSQEWGLDFDYCMDWWCEGDGYSDRSWTGELGLVYGTQLSNNFYLYGEFGGLYGRDRLEQSNNIDKSHESGYFFELGSPIRIGESNTYFDPQIFYRHVVTDYSDGKETKNDFGFNIGLQSYLPCSQMTCDHHHGYSFSKNAYDQGSSFLNFETHGGFKFGDDETTYNNPSFPTLKDNFNEFNLHAFYSYYIINNFALGLEANARSEKIKDKNSNSDNTTSNYSIMPHFIYNPPLANGWNNWFFDGQLGIGSRKNEISGITSSTTKLNSFSYGLGTGYNFFMNPYLSISPEVGYNIINYKNPDTDVKTERHTWSFDIGTKFRF